MAGGQCVLSLDAWFGGSAVQEAAATVLLLHCKPAHQTVKRKNLLGLLRGYMLDPWHTAA